MANKSIIKTAVLALLVSVVGGSIALGGVHYYQNNDSKTHSTAKEKMNVDINSQATKVFQDNKAAVVSVVNLQKRNSPGESEDDNFKLKEHSEGSGVIYKDTGKAAYVVTNEHVVNGSNETRIIMENGNNISAKIVGKDEVTDLAVLKISASNVTEIANFGDSTNIKVGEAALAIGSPLGSDFATSLTKGVISARERTVATSNNSGQMTGYATVIQTDAAINSGNSGGPLFNLAGQIVGINAMKLVSDAAGNHVEGMGFAIPSNEVVKVVDKLEKDGEIIRPTLGIATYDLENIPPNERRNDLNLPANITEGVVVMEIYGNSPVKATDIQKHDVIVQLGGKKVKDATTLRKVLYDHEVNDSISVKYYHEGDLKTATIRLTASTRSMAD